MRTRSLAVVAAVALATATFAALAQTPDATIDKRQQAMNAFKGTWEGTSTCVGDHPSCKNEHVVYRFVPFTAAPWQMRCLADKIVEGKRLPMGAIMFQYDEKSHGLKCDFVTPMTRKHALWSFVLAGDSLRGDLSDLPGGDKVRDVRAVRVLDDSKLPPAPALKDYEE